jgi:antitoxin Phd
MPWDSGKRKDQRGEKMLIDTNLLITMTDANQNFSRVARVVDEHGAAIILKNNRPRYVVVDFLSYQEALDAIKQMDALSQLTPVEEKDGQLLEANE